MRPIGWVGVGFAAGVVTTAAASALAWWWLSPRAVEAELTETSRAAPNPAPVLPVDALSELDAKQRGAILQWMRAHAEYEFVVRDYCGSMEIAQYAQSGSNEKMDYPYAEARDYNGDGVSDVALMVRFTGGEAPWVLVIFNGPFSDGAAPTPAFTTSGWQQNDYIAGAFVGPPESDNGYSIKPKGSTYELVYEGDGG